MKNYLPVLSLWLLAGAVWTGYFTVSSAVDSVEITIAKGESPLKNATEVQPPATNPESISSAATPKTCVAINTATATEIISLSGIGPVIAQRIIEYRNKHGKFSRLKELEKVKGIGPAKLRKLEGHLCF